MGICSYLVISEPGAKESVRQRLAAMPECEVVPSTSHDLLVLVTETGSRTEERSLRERAESLAGVHSMVLTFAEVLSQ